MANPISATRNYLMHAVAELRKVTWPTRELTIRYSVLVVVVCLALGAFFATLDFGLGQAVTIGLSHKPATSASQSAPIPNVVPTMVDVDAAAQQGQEIQVTPGSETLKSENQNASTNDPNKTITLPSLETPKN